MEPLFILPASKLSKKKLFIITEHAVTNLYTYVLTYHRSASFPTALEVLTQVFMHFTACCVLFKFEITNDTTLK